MFIVDNFSSLARLETTFVVDISAQRLSEFSE